MRNRRPLIAALACAILAGGLSSPSLAVVNGTEVIAKSGTVEFTRAELDAWLQSLDPGVRQQALAHHDVLEKLLRAHLNTLALYSEARSKNWDKRPEVQAKIAAASEEIIYGSYLNDITQPPADYPSAAEIQTAYDQNKDKFMAPRSYHLAQIFIATAANADDAAVAAAGKKAAEAAHLAQAKDADFTALARQYSEDHSTSANGGDAGFVAETELLPAVRQVVAGMSKGATSEPIRAGDGFHIVRLLDTKPSALRPLSEVSDQIRAALRQNRQQQLARAYLEKLQAAHPVVINGIELEKLSPNSP